MSCLEYSTSSIQPTSKEADIICQACVIFVDEVSNGWWGGIMMHLLKKIIQAAGSAEDQHRVRVWCSLCVLCFCSNMQSHKASWWRIIQQAYGVTLLPWHLYSLQLLQQQQGTDNSRHSTMISISMIHTTHTPVPCLIGPQINTAVPVCIKIIVTA